MKNSIICAISFSLFPILFLFSQNSDVISLTDLVTTLAIFGIISFVGWVVLSKVLKNQRKSGIIIAIIAVLFFSYGHIFESLPFEWSLNTGGHMHIILLSAYGIIFIGVLLAILKTSKKLDNPVKIACGIGITLCILSLSSSIGNTNEITVQDHDEGISNIESANEKRNIYYIMFDGYASSEILKEIHGYDNSQVVNFLKSKGFVIPEKSYTNYNYSYLSILSILNMEYINYLANAMGETESENRKISYKIIGENTVMNELKLKGYEIYNISPSYFWLEKISPDVNLCGINNYFNSQFQILILRMSMLNPVYQKFFEDDYREKILCTFEEIPKIHKQSDDPVFVFAQTTLPRKPFIFGPNGEEISSEVSKKGIWNNANEKGYLNQVKFAEKMMIEIVEKIRSSDEHAIISIVSDSGSDSTLDWDNPNEEMIKERFGNFNAYYFPNGGDTIIYDGISPVNVFRKILNFYFNEEYEILEDKSYFSNDNKPYDFKDITEILN